MSRVAVAGFTRKGRSRLDSRLSWLAGPSEKHHILRRTSGRFLVLAFFLKVPYEKATFSHDIKGMKKGRFLTELLRFGSSSTMYLYRTAYDRSDTVKCYISRIPNSTASFKRSR